MQFADTGHYHAGSQNHQIAALKAFIVYFSPRKMKFAAVLIFAVFAVAVSEAQIQFAQKLCRTEEDCDWDQCCIDAQTRIPGFHGICDNPTRRGAVCNPDPNDRTEEGRYRKACPCKEGLSCRPKKFEMEGRKQSIYICQE